MKYYSLLKFKLFYCFQEESVEVKLSMHETLVMMASAYKKLPSEKLNDVSMLVDKALDGTMKFLFL